jgi:ethanolamine transporter
VEWIGKIVIGMVMACAFVGAVAAIRDESSELGKEFLSGLHSIGVIFIPVAGIMAAIPLLSQLVVWVLGKPFAWLGADPSLAATSVIAVDMGGYQLAAKLAATKEDWIASLYVGFMAGATIVFSIPVGLSLLDKKEHPYFALGVMCGLLGIPIGVLVAIMVSALSGLPIRPDIATNGPSTYFLQWQLGKIGIDLAPVTFFVIVLALGLRFLPNLMIRLFMAFGRGIDALTKMVLVLCIIEYFTGLFSTLFGAWPLDPIIADSTDPFRALEVAGYIGTMLCGAFPMIYLIRRYLHRPISKIGASLGLEPVGASGLLATVSNILALFRILKDMRPEDKVLNVAFAVSAAFLFGDHLAFTANFQPNLILPVFVGKLAAGFVGFLLAKWLAVPRVRHLGTYE